MTEIRLTELKDSLDLQLDIANLKGYDTISLEEEKEILDAYLVLRQSVDKALDKIVTVQNFLDDLDIKINKPSLVETINLLEESL